MKSLSELYMDVTAIKKLAPSSIKYLTALTLFDLSYCGNLKFLPCNMDNLRSLEKLIISGCSRLKLLPRLPSTVRYIDARSCYSLKPSPALVKRSSLLQPYSQWFPYNESSGGVAFTILYRYLQVISTISLELLNYS